MNLATLDRAQKIKWLSLMTAHLTVCARATYVAGTDDVADPKLLRAYNELIHRVAGALRGYITGSDAQETNELPIEGVHEMLLHFGEYYNRQPDINGAISFVESRMRANTTLH